MKQLKFLKSTPTLGALASLAVFASGPASASISYHDMGGAASTGNITTHYVDATDAFNSVTATTVGLIDYSTGLSTGVSVNITGISQHDHRLGVVAAPAAGTPAASLFNVAGLDLSQGTINVSAGVMTITLTGLDPALLYDLAFYGDRSPTGLDKVEVFTLGGADSAVNSSSTGIDLINNFITKQETRQNTTPGHVVRWTSINPGSDGIITVTMDTSGVGANIGYLNAMRLESSDGGPNTPPTLSAFTGVVDSTLKNTEVEITFAEMAAQGDEADSDGIVVAFVVKSPSTGTLKIGTDAGSAAAYAAGSNDVIDATRNAYWTPTSGATGAALDAFTVVARDNDLDESAPAVQATVAVTGSGGPTASISYHDMGGAQSSGFITNQYVDATNAYNLNPGDAIVALKDYSTGALIGVSVTTTGVETHDHRTPNIVLAPATGTPADPLFNVAGLDLSQGTINTKNTMTFTLTGLSSGLLYDLAFYGDRSVTTTDAVEIFTLGGADSAVNSSSLLSSIDSTFVTKLETRGNYQATRGDVVRWTSINPGIDGAITVTMASLGTNIGYLNAMRLEATGGSPPSNTFADWIGGYDVGVLDGPGDDPDGDGIDNGVENFFGTAPGAFSPGLVASAAAGGTFTFTHPQGTLSADLTATYRWSKDLATFFPEGPGDGTTVTFSTSTDAGVTTVTATAAGSIPDKFFVRVDVTQN